MGFGYEWNNDVWSIGFKFQNQQSNMQAGLVQHFLMYKCSHYLIGTTECTGVHVLSLSVHLGD